MEDPGLAVSHVWNAAAHAVDHYHQPQYGGEYQYLSMNSLIFFLSNIRCNSILIIIRCFTSSIWLKSIIKKKGDIFLLFIYFNNRQNKQTNKYFLFLFFFLFCYTQYVRILVNAFGSGKGIGVMIDIEFDIDGVFIVS